MTVSTGFPIKVAIVQTLRYGHGPRSYVYPEGHAEEGQVALTGKWLHEGFAPEKTPYPFVTYQQIYGPLFYLWGSVLLTAAFDIKVFSKNSVEANNLFALIAAIFDETSLVVAGQSTLICRRIADLNSPDVDEEGQKIYMVGATYEVWTDQPIPRLTTGSLFADAVIV
jgi:hypothetical protein